MSGPGPPLRYHRPDARERDWIRSCQAQTLRASHGGVAPAEEVAFLDARFNAALFDERQCVLVIEGQGALVAYELIGYLWLDMSRAPAVSLLDIYVVPHRRGQGHATATLRRAILHARRAHFTLMVLAVAATNPALALYEKLGFVRTAEKEEHGQRWFRMELRLDRDFTR